MVSRINIIKSKFSTGRDFEESFSEIIFAHAGRCEEIRVVFDRYDANSLKSQTKCSRINGITPVQYSHKYNTNQSLGYPRILGLNPY